jgi:hypothetical protein
MVSNLPHFHDGLLTGVVLGDKTATVFLRQSSGEEYRLLLSGLEVLQMEDFRQGNIISMVEVVTNRLPYEHVGIERLFEPPHPSAAKQYHEAHARVVAQQLSRIAGGEAALVVIVASYGGDLLAICREVSFVGCDTNGG